MSLSDREVVNVRSHRFAHRLATMIDARLLTYREYAPWADDLIMRGDDVPRWILDLTVKKYIPDAVAVIAGFAHSGLLECADYDAAIDEGVAAYYLRYERRELSWASFLESAGRLTDAQQGSKPGHDCEYFFELLNAYVESRFDESIEAKQRRVMAADYGETIRSVRSTYDALRPVRSSK